MDFREELSDFDYLLSKTWCVHKIVNYDIFFNTKHSNLKLVMDIFVHGITVLYWMSVFDTSQVHLPAFISNTSTAAVPATKIYIQYILDTFCHKNVDNATPFFIGKESAFLDVKSDDKWLIHISKNREGSIQKISEL